MRNYKIIGAFIALTVILSGCAQTEFDAMQVDSSASGWTTTHTISQFIATYASDKGDIFPVRPNSGTSNLFSVDTIPRGGSPIVITGTVVSEDVAGNIYKTMVIQDPATGDALKISIDAGSMTGIYPIGQSISIKCNGLAIGKYGDLLQLGIVFYNKDDLKPAKSGYEPGRIPYSLFMTLVKPNGLPEPNKVRVDTMTIADIKSSPIPRSLHSKIVCIKNVKFNGYGEVEFNYMKLSTAQAFFGLPKPTYTGVPVSREIEDAAGNKIYISTSEFSKFASKPLPSSTYVGNVTAIIGWFRDKEGTAQYPNPGGWQLTIRSLNDLGKGFEAYQTTIK
jgi:Family of unknown function (DUF5689)